MGQNSPKPDDMPTDEEEDELPPVEERPLLDAESAKEWNKQEGVARWARHPSATAIMQTLDDSAGAVSVSTLCDRAEISRSTWYEVRDLLDELDLIIEHRPVEDRPMYDANRESETFKAWRQFRLAIGRAAKSRT